MHAAEDVLSMVRGGDRPVTAGLIGDCLACLDQVVQWLDFIEENGELPGDADAAADRLAARFAAGEAAVEIARIEALGIGGEAAVSAGAVAVLQEQISLLAVRGEGLQGRIASAGRLAANVFRHLGRFDVAEQIANALPESLARSDPTSLVRAIELAIGSLTEAPALDRVTPIAIRPNPISRTLRVDAGRVDALVDLTGELTVAKNAIGHIAMRAGEGDKLLSAALLSEHGKLERLIDGLQRAALELRILPLRGVFQRFSRLVREMSVTIDSEFGKGTTVEICLPRYKGDVVDAPVEEVSRGHRAAANEVVLVVEDEAVVRLLIVETLNDLGCRALEAVDSAVALRILQSSQRVDLLVSDIGLPGLNGRQLADAARVKRPGLKVLFVTGYADGAAGSSFLEPGMEIVTKPFTIEALASKIREMIDGLPDEKFG
jgi:CheY-like chemotaxis protein